MSKASLLLTGQDEDYYQAKKTLERRDKKKLFDNITSILYRLEMDRVKPSFEVQAQTGFRRSSLRNKNKRLSRASYDRSPSEDRSVILDPLDRSRNRRSKAEPQKRQRPASMYVTSETQNHPRPGSVYVKSEHQNNPRPSSLYIKAASPIRHQSVHRNAPEESYPDYKAAINYDPYGGESALQQMKKEFLGNRRNDEDYGYSKQNFTRESEKRGGDYTSYLEPGYSTSYRVVTPEPEQKPYWKNNIYIPPFVPRYTSYYPEYDAPRRDPLSQYRVVREARPVAASYERTSGMNHDNDWTRVRPQSTPPNFYRTTGYTPAAEYRNYGLGVVGRKVAESHMDLDYLDRLIDRTFGAKSRSYLPPPESYYVNRYNASPSLSYYLPGSSVYSPYVPYVHTPPIVRHDVPSRSFVRHAIAPHQFVRSVSAYPEQPKVDSYIDSRRVLISPPTRVTRPGGFGESAAHHHDIYKPENVYSHGNNLRPSIRSTRSMSYAPGSNLEYYRDKLRI